MPTGSLNAISPKPTVVKPKQNSEQSIFIPFKLTSSTIRGKAFSMALYANLTPVRDEDSDLLLATPPNTHVVGVASPVELD